MCSIQLAEKIRGPTGEPRGVEAGEVVFGREFIHGLPKRGFEEGSESEEMAALGYVHRPKFARPFEHILEDKAMNILEVREVKSTIERSAINSAIRRCVRRASKRANNPGSVRPRRFLRTFVPG
jgi:hypothetical protein